MNYENLESEDLGAFLETVEQGFSWILDLIDSKDLLYKPQSGSNHAKRKIKKNTLAQNFWPKASKRHNSEYRNFFYALIIAKNIYSIKYLKKNRRAGKQLEKVLKIKC